MSKFLNDWNRKEPLRDMANDFNIDIEVLKSINIIVATYTYENYMGDAFVLFEKDGKLYEVNGSHCSCYGLEDQWEPEEVDLEELRNRFTPSKHSRWCVGYEYDPFTKTHSNIYGLEVLEAINEIEKMKSKKEIIC